MNCQCENQSHFDNRARHEYNKVVDKTVPICTPYGTFHICEECNKDNHMQLHQQGGYAK